MTTAFISTIALLFYLAATWRVAASFFGEAVTRQRTKLQLLVLGGLALVLHGFVLYESVLTSVGLNLGLFNSLSIVAWVIVLLLLAMVMAKPVENLGLLAMPMAAVALLLSEAFHSEHYLPREAGFGLEAHIVLAILAYSILTIAAVQALLLAFQDHQLRNKRPGGFLRALPPLQTMETLLFQLISLGFFLLSLTVVSGMMFLEDMFAQRVAHKTILSIIAWFVFGILLWGRTQFGWRGRTAIRWSLAGFLVLALAFFGTKLVIELIIVG